MKVHRTFKAQRRLLRPLLCALFGHKPLWYKDIGGGCRRGYCPRCLVDYHTS